MSDINTDRPLETPKTLPRKKQLCKFCRLIVSPSDKIVHEERTYHKLCLSQLIDNGSSCPTVDSSTDLTSQNLKDEISTSDQIPISTSNDTPLPDRLSAHELNSNESPSESSDRFYELVDDKLSLKSLDERIENETEASKKSSTLTVDNQLKSVSSNLSSLNPFDDDDDEFYEMNDEKTDEKVKKNNQTNEGQKIEIKISHVDEHKYPKELNPFGSDDEDLEEIDKQELKEEFKVNKSTTSNPFGEEDDDAEMINKDTISNSSKSYVKVYPDQLNPFDENDETIEEINDAKSMEKSSNCQPHLPKNYSTSSLERFNSKKNQSSESKSSSNLRPNSHSFNHNYDTLSIRSLTPDGKWKSNKKRQAPRPPGQQVSSVNTSLNNATTSATSSVSVKQTIHCPNKENDNETTYESSQSLSENENSFVSLTNSDINDSKENISNQQVKKRFKAKPAPLPPTPLIQYVDSIEEIERECDDIGDQLLINSNSIREIETKLKDHQTTKSLSKSSVKKLIYQYLGLIETKCKLDKRQIELSYMKCENKLEKDQVQLDSGLRMLYEKSAKSKTFDDLKLEADLLDKLVDIIERKNEIEENIVRINKSDEFNKSILKIKELVDENIVNPIVEDFKKNYLNESNIRNDLFADVNEEKKKKSKKHKSKGFTFKKISI